MRNLIIILIVLICGMAATPKNTFAAASLSDIFVTPRGDISFFGGYIGGDGDWGGDPSGALDWSIGNRPFFGLANTDDLVISTMFPTVPGGWRQPDNWFERLRITNDGKVGIGTTSPAKPLHTYSATVNAGVLIESGDQDALIQFNDDMGEAYIGTRGGDIILSPSGLLSVMIKNNGNVGIGTNTPQGKLDINGTLAIEGNTGTVGQVLTSQGASAPTWSAPSGDASRFNPFFPDGLDGAAKNIELLPNGGNNYIVPSGKTLYIFTIFMVDGNDGAFNINGVWYWRVIAGNTHPLPLIIPGGSILTASMNDNQGIKITGIEVDAVVTAKNIEITQSTGYTVPSGKTLFIHTMIAVRAIDNANVNDFLLVNGVEFGRTFNDRRRFPLIVTGDSVLTAFANDTILRITGYER